ncbi:hypothetical protein Pla86_48410 [Planctomycetes bacterium Pla86]|uniref:Tetratricopeptide repeat protein n=2 Tax=Engelhardtia mirabilis TaxID=2528011 RepID=A0A518BRX4_9BACT|nr:hypothetical protein Pla133_48430 [Planctomycetes bacterium Pla133]QDV04047.1 hypothetical protein Pla86_48410 [Planctomycetes bacterium Pla86]
MAFTGSSQSPSQGPRRCELCGATSSSSTTPLADGAAQLRAAQQQLERARALEGRSRLLGRLRAVDALHAVGELHQGDSASAAAAAAAAAGELRALGLLDEAAVEIARALDAVAVGPSAARWRLELADLQRRRGEVRSAAATYAACAQDRELDEGDRDHARLWSARMSLALGRGEEAERVLVALAHDARDPVYSVRAFDELVLADVAAGDLGRAAGWIDACHHHHQAVAARDTPSGDRVRRALMRMRGVVELRCAAFDARLRDSDDR